jgi:hypothetical protein
LCRIVIWAHPKGDEPAPGQRPDQLEILVEARK